MMESNKRNLGEPPLADGEAYDPGRLLDQLLLKYRLTRDDELARVLKMDKRLLAMVRQQRQAISGSMLLRMQEASGLTIKDLRNLMKDRRKKARMVCAVNLARDQESSIDS